MAGFMLERRGQRRAPIAARVALLAAILAPAVGTAQAKGPAKGQEAPPAAAARAAAPAAKAPTPAAKNAQAAAAQAAPADAKPEAPAVAKKPWGFLVSEDGKHRIELLTAEVIVGSAASAGARIDHATVSPRHAKLIHKDGVVTITDLGSKFMTLAAGTELKKGKPLRLVQPTLLTFGAIGYGFEWGERTTIPPTHDAAAKAAGTKASKGASKAGKSKGAGGKP